MKTNCHESEAASEIDLSDGKVEIKLSESTANCRITTEREYDPATPIITINDAPCAASGNTTAVTAESKAGKTAIGNATISAALHPDGCLPDFPEIKITPNYSKKAIIGFDTEQDPDDQKSNLKKLLYRAGLKSTPDHLQLFNITSEALKDYQRITEEVFEWCNLTFGGIHLAVIDGVADYISSVNDEIEANAIVSFFFKLAKQYRCAIILVVHLNENAGRNGDTMPRGHLGRQAVRKGYAQLNISKEGDVSKLQVLRARKASSIDTAPVLFKWDKDKGYHVSVDAADYTDQKQQEKEQRSYIRAEGIAKKVFAPPAALRHKDAVEKIQKHTKLSFDRSRKILQDMVGWEMVNHVDEYYRLNLDK